MALEQISLDELEANFAFLGDWEERYRYIIELGRKLPPLPDGAQTDANLVEGCISRVWMVTKVSEENPGALEFLADSDAHIVKGLIAIILMLYSGKDANEILDIDVDEVFSRLGLNEHLSPNRRNGFQSMLLRMKAYAQAHIASQADA